MKKDFINRFVQLRPKAVRKVFRNARISVLNLTRFFGSDGVKSLFHTTVSMSARAIKLLARHPTHSA